MWKFGTVDACGILYQWSAKVFETGSKFGIGGGRISKLCIKLGDRIVYNYDRGEDVDEVDPAVLYSVMRAALE